jgi:hypothetical protein
MNAMQVINALEARELTPCEAVEKLVALGARRKDAEEVVAQHTDVSQGDAISPPVPPTT